jgi:hypothetical protein
MLADAGHAVNHVMKDYGEDLLIETSHSGRIDATRLWIQVKGTAVIDRYRSKDGSLRYSFPVEHVLRWIRTADAVVVVLWDTQAWQGWYADPSQLEGRFLYPQNTVTLRFEQADMLTPESLHKLVWNSRVRHYNNLCIRATESTQSFRGAERGVQSVCSIVALDFLVLLGLAEILKAPTGETGCRLTPAAYEECWDRFREERMRAIGDKTFITEVLALPGDERVARVRECCQEAAIVVSGWLLDQGLKRIAPVDLSFPLFGVCIDLVLQLSTVSDAMDEVLGPEDDADP